MDGVVVAADEGVAGAGFYGAADGEAAGAAEGAPFTAATNVFNWENFIFFTL